MSFAVAYAKLRGRTSRRRSFLSWAFVTALLSLSSGAADAPIMLNGQPYTRAQLEKAYQGVIKHYGKASQRSDVDTVRKLDANLIYGKAIESTGTLTIVDMGAGYAALIGRQRYPVGKADLTFAVKELGTHKWEDPHGREHIIPQYRDLTLSRSEFVRSLRAGYPFAESSLIAQQTHIRMPIKNPAAQPAAGTSSQKTVTPAKTSLRKGKPGSLSARPGSQFQRRKTN